MAHKARPPRSRAPQHSTVGLCAPCGKYNHLTRKAARQARKLTPGSVLNAYRCPHSDVMWHLGNLPNTVTAGHTDRSDTFSRTHAPPPLWKGQT